MKKVLFKKSIAITLMLFTLLAAAACGKKEESKKESPKYATDYPLEVKDDTTVMDKWRIWKREENGVIMLQIWQGSATREEPRDYLTFWVFDTAEQAKEKYDAFYEKSKEYDGGSQWDEGKNWFVSQEPDVFDASIIWMNYLEGNVILSAELSISSEWIDYSGDGTTEAATESATEEKFNPWELKDYVIDNAPSIKDYVLNEILTAS